MLIATTTLIALTVWFFFKEYMTCDDGVEGLLSGFISIVPPWVIGLASGFILAAVLAL
jgi:hypothetical protein